MLNSDILKDVLDGNYVSFKEKVGAEVDSKIRSKLKDIKEKYPDTLAKELNLKEQEEKVCAAGDYDDSDKEKLKCKACGKTFSSKDEFDKHLPASK
jgi:hypothetical protein